MKKTGKLLTVLLLGMLVSTPVHAAEDPDVWCETKVENGNLTASIETNGKATDGVITISYDSSKVTCTGDDVAFADSVEMSSKNVTEGSVKISFLAEKAMDEGSTIATITFKVVDENADPKSVIESFEGEAYDAAGKQLVVGMKNSTPPPTTSPGPPSPPDPTPTPGPLTPLTDTVPGAPTGDTTVILPYLILMLVSGGLLVAFAMKKRAATDTGKKSNH